MARTITRIDVFADVAGDVTLELSLSASFAAFPTFAAPFYTAVLTTVDKLSSGVVAFVVPAGSVLRASVSNTVIPVNITLACMALELAP